MADVVANRVYLTDDAAFQEMNKAYVPHFPKNPPARATVIVGLPGPAYKVEITMTAVKGAKEVITTPAADGTPGKPSPTLSSAIKVGKRLYVAGILGNNADNKGNVEAQTKEAMARIERTLKAAGFEWTDLVDGVVYITDVAQLPGDEQRLSPGARARTSPPARRSGPASSARKGSSRSCSSRRSNAQGLRACGLRACGVCKPVSP